MSFDDRGVEAVVTLLRAAAHLRQQLGSAALDTVALAVLCQRGPLAVAELADLLGVPASTLTSVLDRLERAGLAVRQVRPEDRRSFLLLLTAEGRRRCADAVRAVAEVGAGLLDDPDAARLHRLLAPDAPPDLD